MPRQRVTLRRLFGYSTPYRGRLAWAIVGMIVYAIGSAGLAYLIRPIFDSLLPKQEYVAWTAWAERPDAFLARAFCEAVAGCD